MKMMMLKLMMIFASPATLLAQMIDHNRHHQRPDTVPEMELKPLGRFESTTTTTTQRTHSIHHLHHFSDYYDYNDEYPATYPDYICSDKEWQCKDGTCLQANLHCNGEHDCPDMSDEIDCKISCEAEEWQCQNGECVNKYLYCNGIADCGDETDEVDCDTEYNLYVSSKGTACGWSWIMCLAVALLVTLL